MFVDLCGCCVLEYYEGLVWVYVPSVVSSSGACSSTIYRHASYPAPVFGRKVLYVDTVSSIINSAGMLHPVHVTTSADKYPS